MNAPTLGTIAENGAHKGVRGQKRRHGVTALQALDLRVTPECSCRRTQSFWGSRMVTLASSSAFLIRWLGFPLGKHT